MPNTSDLAGLLEWRCIGPFRGGRVVAVAGDYADPNTFYFGACAGGVWKTLYAHSLSAALLLLFAVSGAAHFVASWRHHAEVQARHGEPVTPMSDYAGDPQFWFESFQNWQSEFLSTAVLIVLAIFLRERGSPESKPVGAPHAQTGT